MVAVTVAGITIEMKHVFSNNGTLYYQRAVPKALQDRLQKRTLKIKLDPLRGSIRLQAERLAKEHDALFKAMLGNKELTISEQKLAAIATLAAHGLKPNDGNDYPDINEQRFGGLQPHLDSFMDEYIEKHRDGVTSKEEDLAYKMLYKPLPMVLSEALEVYYEEHPRGNEDDFRKNTKHYWDLFIDHAGDIALLAVERETVKDYIRKRLTLGKKTGTVEKELSIIGAVFNKARITKSINCINPFEKLSVPNAGKDAKKKIVLSKEQLSAVIKAAEALNDDIRRIVLLQAATGARISEIVGLRVEDVTKLNQTTYLKLQTHDDEHGIRSLKTTSSIREIPLIGFAAKVAENQRRESPDVWLFQRYVSKDGKVNADSASGAVNKWLKQQIAGLTSHSFRHTIKTYLREVTSKSISDQITGHASQDASDQYGLGVSLQTKLDALNKAFVGVDVRFTEDSQYVMP